MAQTYWGPSINFVCLDPFFHGELILAIFKTVNLFREFRLTVNYQPRPMSEIAHLSWCIMVAVRLAQQEGKALSDLERHLFIMQWLHFAQKRHLFSKTIASDITWLLAQGKKYGFSANLHRKIEFIYRSSMGDLAAQSLLFRFTYFIETLKTMGWQNFLLSPHEWSAHWHASSAANAIYTPKAELRSSFNDNGVLIKPLTIRATGDIAGIIALIEQCHLTIEQHPDELDFYVFLLTS